MKTIIILVGSQATFKSTFLKTQEIEELFFEDFKSEKDFKNKPDLFAITSNDLFLTELDKFSRICDVNGEYNILIFKLPYVRIATFTNNNFYIRLVNLLKILRITSRREIISFSFWLAMKGYERPVYSRDYKSHDGKDISYDEAYKTYSDEILNIKS